MRYVVLLLPLLVGCQSVDRQINITADASTICHSFHLNIHVKESR